MSKRIILSPVHIFIRFFCPVAIRATPRPVRVVPTLRCVHTSSRRPVHASNHLKSTISFTSTVVLVLVASSLAVGSVYLKTINSGPGDQGGSTASPTFTKAVNVGIMVGPVLPGRPGNLTADQEAKLQELWTATLRVFNVQAADRPEDAATQQPGSGTATPDKKAKKKKQSMFRRRKEDDDDAASTDLEDKYGQGKEFQHVLATQEPEKLRTAFWSMVKHDHPDGLLLRFLRARKWDVHNALVMLIATMNWRMKEQHVDDDIMKKGEGQAVADSSSSNAAVKKEGEDFLAQLRLGKSFLHGTDKEGRPMCFVRVRLHRQGEQSNTSLEKYTVYTIETARLLLAPNVDTAVSHNSDDMNSLAHHLAGNRFRYDWFLNGEHGWFSLN